MPKSSVFLRLQWPSSSSSESSHEISSVPSSVSSVEPPVPACSSDSSAAEIGTATNSVGAAMRDPRYERITGSLDANADPQLKADWNATDVGSPNFEEARGSQKKKVKFREKGAEKKARRMARSLSASSATVSTSTDPEDFLFACIVSNYCASTLPRNLKEISGRVIVPRVEKTSSEGVELEAKVPFRCEVTEDIPYIDTKEGIECESSFSPALESHSSSSLLKKFRQGSLFGCISKNPKTEETDDLCAAVDNRYELHQPGAAEQDTIPDILSDCNLNRSFSLDDSCEEQFQEMQMMEDSQHGAAKKTVKFLLPPEYCDSLISEGADSASGEYPPSGYAELDGGLMPPNGGDPYRNSPSPGMHGVPNDRYVRWRDPDLHEVIDFLSNPNNIVKANAAAYLQHLCYMDDATKQKARILGGIPPLVALLSHDLPELHRNACGALRNLSYGRQNDENKRAIKEAGGLPTLVRLLRKTLDNEVKELVTGILWNLSSCEELKQSILDEALGVLVSHVIIPCSGWDGGDVERDPNNDVWWSTVFKNASGIIRNISSAGEYARTKLRHCPGLVDSLFCVIKLAIQGNSHDNKSVENCVCILRNLSYRCQEVEDPNYDKNQLPTQSRATATGKGDNLGCFGGSRKKKEMVGGQLKEVSSGQRSTAHRGQPVRGMELLWQPELVVQPYLALLSDCSNPETLEAAAGAIQNLAACYWQPSIDVRAAVRKEKGLPILVELLRMEVDRVVCAVATALRNLAIDQRNKELIGKYAMRDLVQKLPSHNSHDSTTSGETIAAVLATLNEVIKKNAEFSRSLLDAGGVDRLVFATRQRGRYSGRVIKFASQVLFSMWGHPELREVYKKAGWKEQDFVSKSVAARNAAGGANSPTANNTLNRPMASQGGTRYEDRTIQRSNNQSKHHQYQRREEVPLADLGYGGDGGAPGGGLGIPQH